ncbi:MAG: terminase large subunit [Vibrio hibernica]
MTTGSSIYHQYALDVQSGVIPACKAIKGAVSRYFDDLARDDIYLDHIEAERFLRFSTLATHFKGELTGQAFVIEPWEAWILVNAICWKWKGTNHNKHREIFVFVPRKNGKSFICSLFANYLLLVDDAQHDVFSYAMNATQARLVFDGAKQMINQSKPMRKRAQVWAHHIDHTPTNSRFKPICANSGGNEGLGGSSICDEYHTHPDDSMHSVMQLSMAARKRAWHFTITTAGTSMISACHEYYDYCKNVATGVIESDSVFAAIYELDDEKEIEQPSLWVKANPNMGVSIYEDELTDTITKAKAIPSKWTEVLVKRFNIWRNGESEFISLDKWQQCHNSKIAFSKHDTAFIGLDLSSHCDLTALWLVVPTGETGAVKIKGQCYLPSAALEQGKKNAEAYQRWADRGYITIIQGDTIDYEFIERDIYDLCERFNVQSVAFDPWNSNQMITRLESNGVETEKVRQGFVSLSPTTKALQTAILQGKIEHDNNPVLNWAMGNVVLSHDAADNVKPDKSKSQNKIDPVAALINAYRTWMLEEEQGEISEEVETFTW